MPKSRLEIAREVIQKRIDYLKQHESHATNSIKSLEDALIELGGDVPE
jgi:hypothetical protein